MVACGDLDLPDSGHDGGGVPGFTRRKVAVVVGWRERPHPRSATGDRPNKPPSFASCVAACGGDVTGTDGALDLSAQYDLCPVTGKDFHCSSSYVSDGETMPQWITDLRPVCVGRG